MTQTMRTNYDCGPVALYNALAPHLFTDTYGEFLRLWGFPDADSYRDNLRDQPGDHLTVLRKLDVLHRRVNIAELLDGIAPAGKTVVLMHNPENPILQQHWVRFVRYDRLSERYYFDWGDGTYHNYDRQSVYKMFTAGLPDYAYCVGESEASKLSRLANWFWLKLRSIMKFFTRS